jgi:hypothetical protein
MEPVRQNYYAMRTFLNLIIILFVCTSGLFERGCKKKMPSTLPRIEPTFCRYDKSAE